MIKVLARKCSLKVCPGHHRILCSSSVLGWTTATNTNSRCQQCTQQIPVVHWGPLSSFSSILDLLERLLWTYDSNLLGERAPANPAPQGWLLQMNNLGLLRAGLSQLLLSKQQNWSRGAMAGEHGPEPRLWTTQPLGLQNRTIQRDCMPPPLLVLHRTTTLNRPNTFTACSCHSHHITECDNRALKKN